MTRQLKKQTLKKLIVDVTKLLGRGKTDNECRDFDAQSLIDHLHDLGATRIDISAEGGVCVEFPPAERFKADELLPRLCPNCGEELQRHYRGKVTIGTEDREYADHSEAERS